MQLQRLHSKVSRAVLICATNCPWELDPAFLRRFEKRIYVGLPELEARRDLLDRLLVVSFIVWKLSFAFS